MRAEESEVLPLAEKYLTAENGRAIDPAFDANRDPLVDVREHVFQSLFTRIVDLAPAPVGLGERSERA